MAVSLRAEVAHALFANLATLDADVGRRLQRHQPVGPAFPRQRGRRAAPRFSPEPGVRRLLASLGSQLTPSLTGGSPRPPDSAAPPPANGCIGLTAIAPIQQRRVVSSAPVSLLVSDNLGHGAGRRRDDRSPQPGVIRSRDAQDADRRQTDHAIRTGRGSEAIVREKSPDSRVPLPDASPDEQQSIRRLHRSGPCARGRSH
jgi:hypothetical protein